MPGILGLITKMPHAQAVRQLARMSRTLQHEPFYTEGSLADDSLGIYVAWTAHRGSFCDAMPLRSERGDVVLVFSGRDFPAPETLHQLKHHGHELRLNGPNYLVHLYEDDPSFPANLNGRFHGLVIDHKLQTAQLFNDRYGMHRIYYHESGDGFYFASEAKAILAVCPTLKELDAKGAGEFVACGAVLENRTLFKGIGVLPPGSAWKFRNGELNQKNCYFHPKQWEEQENLDPESYYSELRDVFTRNLPRYFDSSDRIGMSLTGGLDTRIIMACHKSQRGSLPCYTFGGLLRDSQDVIVARKIAQACGQTHEVIRVDQEFLAQFPRYVERTIYLTDGGIDVGLCPDLYLHERARQISPVRMTGLYGSEILRGIRAFKPEEFPPKLFTPEFISYLDGANESYRELVQAHPVSFAAFRQAPWYHHGILALEETQLCVRTPFLDNDLVRTALRAPKSALHSNAISLRLIADGNPALARIPTDRGVGGNRGRFAESVSHAFLEFLFKAEYAYDMGMPQWLASLEGRLQPLHMERFFLGRHKISHFRIWYRDILASYLQEILLDAKALSRPYLERKQVQALVAAHIKGNRNHTTELHKLLTLEIVHRLFIDGCGTEDRNRDPRIPADIKVGQLGTALRAEGAAGAVPPEEAPVRG